MRERFGYGLDDAYLFCCVLCCVVRRLLYRYIIPVHTYLTSLWVEGGRAAN